MKKSIPILILTTFLCQSSLFSAPQEGFTLRPPMHSNEQMEGFIKDQNKQEELSADLKRAYDALEKEIPIINESSKWNIRLYFLKAGLQVFISMSVTGYLYVSVSNYDGKKVGENIEIKDQELLKSKTRSLIEKFRSNEGINTFLKVVERDEADREMLLAIKKKYAREVVTDAEERSKILKELGELLDTDTGNLSSQQIDRIQQLLAFLGYEPFYPPDKFHPDEYPKRPMDEEIYNIKQGDIVYIQYGILPRDNEEEVVNEISGFLRKVPGYDEPRVVEMTTGEKIDLGSVEEIIVDEGRGGHYRSSMGGNVVPYDFLMGGYLKRDVIKTRQDMAEEALDGVLGEADYVSWPGIDRKLPIKFITKYKEHRKDAWVRMTGEKVVVLEAPGTQNNGVFMYQKADGRFGNHDMVDVNRIYFLGVDKEITKLGTHLFKEGDRVVVDGGDGYYHGVVESFYVRAFIGRRMVVKLDEPPDPSKPYVHVKFSHQGEAALVDAKNAATKTLITDGFKAIYETINAKFIIDSNIGEKTLDFWEKFKGVYVALFDSKGLFYKDDFNVQAMEEVFRKTIGMTLEQIINGITEANLSQDMKSSPFIKNNPLAQISSLLDEAELNILRREYYKIKLGMQVFAGQKVSSTGTSPWCVKEKDIFAVLGGQVPSTSSFTIIALLHYFSDKYVTFEERLRLAYKVAGAREHYSLEDSLNRIWENKDKLDGLSQAALDIAAEEYTKNLNDPDDIKAVRFVLGLKDALPETLLEKLKQAKDIESNV